MARHLRSLAVAAAGLLALAGCSAAPTDSPGDASSEPVPGGTLTVARSNPFEGFELDKQTLNSSFQLSQAVLEPLIRPGEDGMSLVPGVASEWEFNDDDTVLTVHIDPDASFSDGEPVVAADVVFSVELWKSGPNYGATYMGIDEAVAVDDETVELRLAYPSTALPAYLSWANAGIVPDDFGGRSAEEFWQSPIGAGPFAVESWSANGEVVLTKSAHYHVDGQPYLDEVVSTYASDPNSIALQLRSGELDLADEIMPVTAASLPEELVDRQAEHLTPVLLMNTTAGALSDVSVRQGIAYAIDYDAIASTALHGYAVPPRGALPTNSEHWAAPSEPYFSKDPDAAARLLGDTEVGTLTLTYPNDPSSALMAQIVQASLDEAGVTVELVAADAASAFATISSGDYELGIFSYNAISPDASDPAQYVAATQTMFTGAPTEELWSLLGAYESAPTDADKEAGIRRIQDLLSAEAPFVALAHGSALEGVGERVRGLKVLPWGVYDLAGVWVSS